jgi:hypothetical protein
MNWFFRKYIQQGRQEMLTQVIHKFEELYDDYYGQGQFDDANLIVDLVAYLQDDYEAISNND